jgi:hypothetical protein
MLPQRRERNSRQTPPYRPQQQCQVKLGARRIWHLQSMVGRTGSWRCACVGCLAIKYNGRHQVQWSPASTMVASKYNGRQQVQWSPAMQPLIACKFAVRHGIHSDYIAVTNQRRVGRSAGQSLQQRMSCQCVEPVQCTTGKQPQSHATRLGPELLQLLA